MITLTRILVPHDLNCTSDHALAYARKLARTFGAQLVLLHVMENPFMRAVAADPRDIAAGMRRQLDDRLTDDDRRVSRATIALDESDHPADAILDFARNEKIDLIVMGTHGRRAMNRLLMGSVAERVVRLAPCPVLTVQHSKVSG
jgi:nucleotide-binding universal stress UspA family protein